MLPRRQLSHRHGHAKNLSAVPLGQVFSNWNEKGSNRHPWQAVVDLSQFLLLLYYLITPDGDVQLVSPPQQQFTVVVVTF